MTHQRKNDMSDVGKHGVDGLPELPDPAMHNSVERGYSAAQTREYAIAYAALIGLDSEDYWKDVGDAWTSDMRAALQSIGIEAYVRDIDNALAVLRNAGYLVIAWTPEELGTVDTDALEDYLISVGHYYIEDS